MPNLRSRGALAVAVTVLLLALVTAGCGRRGLPAAAGVGDPAASAAASGFAASPTTAAAVEPTQPAEPAEPAASGTVAATPSLAATQPPAAGQPPAQGAEPTAAPLQAPDLADIERLLADLDAALGADATADTDEGSPQ